MEDLVTGEFAAGGTNPSFGNSSPASDLDLVDEGREFWGGFLAPLGAGLAPDGAFNGDFLIVHGELSGGEGAAANGLGAMPFWKEVWGIANEDSENPEMVVSAFQHQEFVRN